jgi:hypothetical protein
MAAMPGRRRPRGAGREEEHEARLGASREIGQALRMIRAVRTLYVACAVVAGLWLLLFLLVALPDNTAWRWMVGIAGASTVLLAVGSVQVTRRPVPWSVGIAVAISVFVGITFLLLGPSLHTSWGILIAVALWVTVGMARKAHELAARHPDLYGAEVWRGTRAKPRETARGQRVRARQRSARQSELKMWAVPGAVALLVVCVLLFWPRGSAIEETEYEPPPPPPPFGARPLAFQRAWNEGTLDDIAAFIDPGDRSRRMAKIRRILDRRGWLEKRPRLDEPVVAELSRGIQTTFALRGYEEGVAFKVYWQTFEVNGVVQWWWMKSKWPSREAAPPARR